MASARLQPWVPVAFAVCLSGIVMAVMMTAGSFEPSFPAFFCFLPMVFFFVAQSQLSSQKQIADLESRVKRLEERIVNSSP